MPEIDFLNKKTFTKTSGMINLRKSATIESPQLSAKGRDFVHQGKIEIDVNERAVFIRTQGCFFVYTNSDCFLNSLLLT